MSIEYYYLSVSLEIFRDYDYDPLFELLNSDKSTPVVLYYSANNNNIFSCHTSVETCMESIYIGQ